MSNRTLMSLLIAAMLSACGGGGGGGDGGGDASALSEPATPQIADTVSSIVPGTAMTWSTATAQALSVVVLGDDSKPASGASVRVFSATRESPQGGEPLPSPVPLALLDSAITDAAGKVTFDVQVPSHVTDILVVSTSGDLQSQQAVTATGGFPAVNLTLAR